MSSTYSISLKHRRSGEFRGATLWDGIGREQVNAAEAIWRPFLEEQLARLEREGNRSAFPQHRHWDWRKKLDAIEGLLACRIFGVECEGEMQGLMLVATAGRACRIESQVGRPLVYVHFLATAPWNNPAFGEPRFSGVGTILIRSAIELSLDEEFAGRIGLHSLPQADAWYQKCGMTDLGPDETEKQRLRYFEMTPEQAKALLA